MLLYFTGVDSSHLKASQLAMLRAILGRNLRFLNKLCARCQRLGWPIDDPVCQGAQRARDAVQDLFVAVGYASQSHGVGTLKK